MKTCEDCIHYYVCYEGLDRSVCSLFKDKSKFIELPCSIGDIVYYPYAGKILEKKVTAYHRIYDSCSGVQGINWWYELDNDESETMDTDIIGSVVFLTREEAEKKLEVLNHGNQTSITRANSSS